MSQADVLRPTEAELSILRVLWGRGPSTVRQVQAELNKDKPTGYTTVLKFLQIMTEKGLVVRDQTQRTHVYQPRYTRNHTQRQLAQDLLERAFGGSHVLMVAQTLLTRKASRDELAEIRLLVERLEREGR